MSCFAEPSIVSLETFSFAWIYVQLNLGLTRLRRRVEKIRVTRLGVWRAGVWAAAYIATGALERWRKRARAQRGIEISFRIARSRNQTRKMVRARCSPLGRISFESWKRHARARKLERRVFRAWASYTERATQASKQVRAHVHTGKLVQGSSAIDTIDTNDAKILPISNIARFPWRLYTLLLLSMSCEDRGMCGWHIVES